MENVHTIIYTQRHVMYFNYLLVDKYQLAKSYFSRSNYIYGNILHESATLAEVSNL